MTIDVKQHEKSVTIKFVAEDAVDQANLKSVLKPGALDPHAMIEELGELGYRVTDQKSRKGYTKVKLSVAV